MVLFASDRTGHVSCVFEHCFPTSSSARYPTSVCFTNLGFVSYVVIIS